MGARFGRVFGRAIEALVGALLGGVVFVSVLQVFYRYVLNQALAWPDELGRFLFVWLTWLGAAAGVRRNVHIKLTVFVDRLPAGVQRWIHLGVTVLVIGLLLGLLRGTPAVLDATRGTIFTALPFSTVYQYWAAPVGSVIMLGYLVRDLVRLVRGAPAAGEV